MNAQQPKKKLMFIIGVMRNGGAQRAGGNISLALADAYDISFVVFSADKATYRHGGKLYDLHLPPKTGRIAKLMNELRKTHALRKIKKQLRPDYCISFLDDASFPNVRSAGYGKTIVSLRTHLSSRPMGRATAAKVKYTYSKADKVVCVSKVSMLDLLRLGYTKPENCVAIGNMVDTRADLLSVNKPISREDKQHLHVATMGRLSAQKGMWTLIRAFALVHREHPEAKLSIFGGGDEAPYQKLIDDLGLSGCVTLQGYVTDPHAMVAKADLFVFPSRFEGMPNALLEAMSLGLPVISTDCLSGPREILAPDTDLEEQTTLPFAAPWGILIPTPTGPFLDADVPITDDERMMASEICKMLSDEQLRSEYARKALTRAADFSPEYIRQQWIDFLESL